jgi:hypothetical protein
MSFTTFSGPIRAGTVRQGTVASGENTGVVMLAQTATVSYAAMTTSPTAQALFVLPAGSKIVRFDIEVVTAISGGSVSNVGVTIGNVGTANKYMTTVSTTTSSVKVVQATIDAAMVVAQTNNIGTSDVTIYGTFTAATGNPTAGSMVVTVEYMQRAQDGSAEPV